MMGQVPSSEIWQRVERAVVEGDASTLDALLRDHGELLRTGPVQSTWWGGLAPDYSKGDARAIIAGEHRLDSWDQFAGFVEALSDRSSPVAQFEAAVVTGDEATLERLIQANPTSSTCWSPPEEQSNKSGWPKRSEDFRLRERSMRTAA